MELNLPARNDIIEKIFNIRSESDFEKCCLWTFQYQVLNSKVYSDWVKALGVEANKVSTIEEIPFLPISFFKTHQVTTAQAPFDIEFSSSGTTGTSTSKHFVKDADLYKRSFISAFEQQYGDSGNCVIIGLLPSYLERTGSSLIYMCEELISKSKRPESGFYLNDFEKLRSLLSLLKQQNQKTVLFGVAYALLDFAELHPPTWNNLYVIETGGMKGRRKEMVRDELHEEIRNNWPVLHLHSEYGMTELMSQAYYDDNKSFVCPPWMQLKIRDTTDPFCYLDVNKTGGINIIDLANLDSCSFIATQDLGKRFNNGRFEVLGRFDHSDIRGCNLLVQ
jgi:phenylacetate-coenzyme A ligase PaaK-like adenylate-forming protein